MMTKKRLTQFHEAAKMIEADGIEAYYSVCERFGEDIAGALLIAHLRRAWGSMKGGWPPSPELVEEVNRVLREDGILE